MNTCAGCNATIPRGSRFCPKCGAPVLAGADDLLASASSDPTGLLERLRRAVGNEYTIIRELGRGGMGRVFLAEERALQRRVAIKVLPPDLAEHAEIARRFRREARTAGQLSHPHIMPVYQVAERDGLHFFTMPLVSGPSLRQILRRTPRLPVELCRRYVLEAADALYYAHGQGVIHRDIKPENMLLEGGPDGRLLLTDFGIAKAIGAATTTLTRPGALMGTPYYMAPEICGEFEVVDARADQYSLGMVAYEMLAGRFPLTADSLAGIVYKHLHDDPDPLEAIRPDVPEDVRRLIERAIHKDPDERFPSMKELRDALQLTGAAPAGSRRMRARRSLSVALVAFVAAVGVLVGSLLHLHGGAADQSSAETSGATAEDTGSLVLPRGGEGGAPLRDDSLPPVEGQRPAVAGAARGRDRDQPPAEAAREGVVTTRESAADRAVVPLGRDVPSREGRESDEGAGAGAPDAIAARDSAPTLPADSDSGAARSVADQPQTGGKANADSAATPEAEATPPRSDPRIAIAALLEVYREALEAEDLGRLGVDVYRDSIPAADAQLLSYWFERGEGFRIGTELVNLVLDGDSAAARVRQKMAFRLESTGDRREITESFVLHFRLERAGWRLTRLERRR